MISALEIENIHADIVKDTETKELIRLLANAENDIEAGYAIKAKESLLFVLKKSTDIDFHEGIVRALTGLGKASLVLSIFEEALDYLAQAETIVLRHFPSSTFHGDILSHKAVVHKQRGEYDAALELNHKALNIFVKNGDRKREARTIGNIANIYVKLGEFAKAMEHYQPSLRIYEELKDLFAIARTLNNMGNIFRHRSLYNEALEYYGRALTINTENNYWSNTAQNYNNIGNVHRVRGDFEMAKYYYKKAIEVSTKLGSQEVIAQNLENLGNAHYGLAEYSLALECYQKALEIRNAIGTEQKGSLYLNLGNLHHALEDYYTALYYYHHALDDYKQFKRKSSVGDALANIGALYSLTGQYDMALDYLHQALESHINSGKKIGISNVFLNIGNIYRLQGMYEQAFETLQLAEPIIHEAGSVYSRAMLLYIKAQLLAKKEYDNANTEIAEQLFNEALVLFATTHSRKEQYEVSCGLATLYKEQGRWKEAGELFEQCLELQRTVFSEKSQKDLTLFDLKQKVILAEQEKKIAEHEAEIYRLRSVELFQKNALVQKELEATIEIIVQKNTLIKKINDTITDAVHLSPQHSRQTLYDLLDSLEAPQLAETERSRLQAQIKTAYSNFIQKLEADYPSLSETELKVCTLLSMGLSSSKIAITFGVSQRTIEKHREHIRKKIGLHEQSLTVFLQRYAVD
ncbi:MAG: tetratricopeptide repeat protein [Ignavibacteria bacterium]|nr:tetratricopeptide repeat protein [Ignavibacteria bacterium]